MFLFVVRNFRWLARIPFFPQIFDGLLLAFTWIVRPARVRAMEKLEEAMTGSEGISCRTHRFGGMEFHHRDAGELGHIHGHGLLDLRLDREEARRLITLGQVRPHHVLPGTGWVSFQLESCADVPVAMNLLAKSKATATRANLTLAAMPQAGG